jgi:hypothetical protein
MWEASGESVGGSTKSGQLHYDTPYQGGVELLPNKVLDSKPECWPLAAILEVYFKVKLSPVSAVLDESVDWHAKQFSIA